MLRVIGKLQGGSAISADMRVRKSGAAPSVISHLPDFI
jgi:hypothetical protein